MPGKTTQNTQSAGRRARAVGRRTRSVDRRARPADKRANKRPGVANQRRKIIEATVSLLQEHGSRTLSVSQICQAVGISRPTFYRCFKDIDALISELYSSAVDLHTRALIVEPVEREGWHYETMRPAIDKLLESIFANAVIADLVFREASDPSSPAFAIVDEAFEQIVDVLDQQLSQSQGPGPGRIYLKATLAASQWIAHDAIRKGLTKKTKADAKAALWRLVENSLKPYYD